MFATVAKLTDPSTPVERFFCRPVRRARRLVLRVPLGDHDRVGEVGGEVPVPGLESVKLGAGEIAALSIPEDPGSLGRPLVVVADQPIIVQRLWTRNNDLAGRSASLAMPG